MVLLEQKKKEREIHLPHYNYVIHGVYRDNHISYM